MRQRARKGPPRHLRRMQSHDPGRVPRRRSVYRGSEFGLCAAISRSAGGCAGTGAAVLAIALATPAAAAAELSGQMGQLAAGSPASPRAWQPALAVDDAGAAGRSAAAVPAMARPAARAAAAPAPAVAAIQEPAARTAAARARAVPAVSPVAAGASPGVAPAMAPNESRAAAPGDSAACGASPGGRGRTPQLALSPTEICTFA